MSVTTARGRRGLGSQVMRSTWLEGLVGGKGEGAALDSDV